MKKLLLVLVLLVTFGVSSVVIPSVSMAKEAKKGHLKPKKKIKHVKKTHKKKKVVQASVASRD